MESLLSLNFIEYLQEYRVNIYHEHLVGIIRYHVVGWFRW